MSDNDLPEVSGVTSVFPFVMVLSAVFTTGAVFTVANVPLVLELLRAAPDSPPFDVVAATGQFWQRTLLASPSVGAVVLDGLALFIIGLIVQPVAGSYVTLVGWVVKRLWAGFNPPPVLFGKDYALFAAWIHRHRVEKTHWEWELFNHYLYAGVAFNVLLWAFLFWLLVGRGPLGGLGLVITVVASTSYSLAKSALVQHVYSLYFKRATDGG